MERTFSFANAADGIEITHDTLFSSIKSAIPLQRVFITSNVNRVKEGEVSSKISKQPLSYINFICREQCQGAKKSFGNFQLFKK
jgi:hypothetical protein